MTTQPTSRSEEKIRLCRHRDDEYWDEVTIHAPLHEGRSAGLGVHVIPRYKTSGLSGDEWRISARITLSNRKGTFFERDFGKMSWAMNYAPHFVWTEAKELLNIPEATLVVSRKGRTLWHSRFNTFADAALCMAWHIVVANEQSPNWHHLTDEEERAHCQQPGCEDPPECLYRLKKIQYGHSRCTFMDPVNDFDERHRWFCARHAERGNCGLEDNDKNYDVIIAVDPKRDPRDVRRSILGGVICVEDIDTDVHCPACNYSRPAHQMRGSCPACGAPLPKD